MDNEHYECHEVDGFIQNDLKSLSEHVVENSNEASVFWNNLGFESEWHEIEIDENVESLIYQKIIEENISFEVFINSITHTQAQTLIELGGDIYWYYFIDKQEPLENLKSSINCNLILGFLIPKKSGILQFISDGNQHVTSSIQSLTEAEKISFLGDDLFLFLNEKNISFEIILNVFESEVIKKYIEKLDTESSLSALTSIFDSFSGITEALNFIDSVSLTLALESNPTALFQALESRYYTFKDAFEDLGENVLGDFLIRHGNAIIGSDFFSFEDAKSIMSNDELKQLLSVNKERFVRKVLGGEIDLYDVIPILGVESMRDFVVADTLLIFYLADYRFLRGSNETFQPLLEEFLEPAVLEYPELYWRLISGFDLSFEETAAYLSNQTVVSSIRESRGQFWRTIARYSEFPFTEIKERYGLSTEDFQYTLETGASRPSFYIDEEGEAHKEENVSYDAEYFWFSIQNGRLNLYEAVDLIGLEAFITAITKVDKYFFTACLIGEISLQDLVDITGEELLKSSMQDLVAARLSTARYTENIDEKSLLILIELFPKLFALYLSDYDVDDVGKDEILPIILRNIESLNHISFYMRDKISNIDMLEYVINQAEIIHGEDSTAEVKYNLNQAIPHSTILPQSSISPENIPEDIRQAIEYFEANGIAPDREGVENEHSDFLLSILDRDDYADGVDVRSFSADRIPSLFDRFLGRQEVDRNDIPEFDEIFHAYYLGIPLTPEQREYLTVSEFRPSNSIDTSAIYYKVPNLNLVDPSGMIKGLPFDDVPENQIIEFFEGERSLPIGGTIELDFLLSNMDIGFIDPIRNAQISYGEDGQGKYFAIYDIYDYDFLGKANEFLENISGGLIKIESLSQIIPTIPFLRGALNSTAFNSVLNDDDKETVNAVFNELEKLSTEEIYHLDKCLNTGEKFEIYQRFYVSDEAFESLKNFHLN